ncbi:S1-like domain-containing RNA-binding protein [Hydrogenimonas sp.]|uniref:CvfB family protein n=1 Tax=Hydrogenimonas sp. TaxID=2231112 RepID=UPI0026331521|nr:S1-like domain-containing RNA-binding protein [Hydrogenimonas sp.]
MNRYLELGAVNRLEIVRSTDYGLVLSSKEGKEVLLPKRYVTEEMAIEEVIDVFVYTDSEDRLVATTERPVAMLGEAAVMEVVDVTSQGAFVDWGLPKDLFVPKMFQREPMKKGERHIVLVDYDERTHRLVGTQKIDRKLAKASKKSLKRNQEVELLIYGRTDLGYKAVVEKRYDGLVFHSEVFEPIEVGETKRGYVKQIRDDGKIDLLLRPIGKKSDDLAAQKVLDYLESHKGMMPLNYKSDPERIKELLGLSRKNFKRALTKLIESGKVEVKENGTFLRMKNEK